MLDMGDDGGRPRYPGRTDAVGDDRRRVSLTAIATATAGPISFVALAAPQLARTAHSLGGGDGHRVGRDGSAGTGGQ